MVRRIVSIYKLVIKKSLIQNNVETREELEYPVCVQAAVTMNYMR
ncbi:hypothetical protein SDC9_41893 [bioreactor metagenome]|uniref:Uncharacterized protein n=1 Tax=bioreactor metagenome TaxID=1076179 RepID=A0A644VWD9_9ZZZZ